MVNGSNTTIAHLYVSPNSSNYWGPDVLGSSVLAPGRATLVEFSGRLSTCMYDLKVRTSDGLETVRYDVNLCQTSGFTYH